jgi:Na+-translocating ferredoxin:NAD+ oxidoreductase RnfD subunit
MSVLMTVVGAFVLALVVATLMWGGAGLVIALPVALVVLGVAFALNLNKRRTSAATIHEQRERARTQKVDFTERDEQTLVSE